MVDNYSTALAQFNLPKELLQNLDDLHFYASRISSMQERQAAGSGVSSANVYSTDGYDAASVGGNSTLDTTINSGASLISWLSWL